MSHTCGKALGSLRVPKPFQENHTHESHLWKGFRVTKSTETFPREPHSEKDGHTKLQLCWKSHLLWLQVKRSKQTPAKPKGTAFSYLCKNMSSFSTTWIHSLNKLWIWTAFHKTASYGGLETAQWVRAEAHFSWVHSVSQPCDNIHSRKPDALLCPQRTLGNKWFTNTHT